MNEVLELNSQFVADFQRLQRESDEARAGSDSSEQRQRELAATREQLDQLRRQLAELEGHVEQRRAQRDEAVRQRDEQEKQAAAARQRVAQLQAQLQGRAADTDQARRTTQQLAAEQLKVAHQQRDAALKQAAQLDLELKHARQELKKSQQQAKQTASAEPAPAAPQSSQYPCPECGHRHKLDQENLEELSQGQKKIWRCEGCSHLFWLTPPKATGITTPENATPENADASNDRRLQAAVQSLQQKLESLEVDYRLLNEKHKRLKKQNYDLHNELLRLQSED